VREEGYFRYASLTAVGSLEEERPGARFASREKNDRHTMEARYSVHHGLVLAGTLAVLWLALSGHYTGLLLCLGFASVVLCVWIAARMGILDEETHPAQFHLLPCLLYGAWLTREIWVSALDVARRVLDPSLPISPRVVSLPLAQRTDAGRVVYANSITLTPGTVSIDLGKDFVQVHALTEEGAQALAGGEMNDRVAALERGD
jgi:multicomponent Na+:H+ antiporter subunit E